MSFLLQSSAVHSSPSWHWPRKTPPSRFSMLVAVPTRKMSHLVLGSAGQRPARERLRLGPGAGVEVADDHAGAGAPLAAVRRPGAVPAGQPEEVRGVPGVQPARRVLGDQQHPAVGGQLQRLLTGQPGREAVGRDRVAGHRPGADLASDRALGGAQVRGVGTHRGRVGAELGVATRAGRTEPRVPPVVPGGAGLTQQDHVAAVAEASAASGHDVVSCPGTGQLAAVAAVVAVKRPAMTTPTDTRPSRR